MATADMYNLVWSGVDNAARLTAHVLIFRGMLATSTDDEESGRGVQVCVHRPLHFTDNCGRRRVVAVI